MIIYLYVLYCWFHVFSFFFFFKQMTAYEMRISDWSSDVCSSDLRLPDPVSGHPGVRAQPRGDRRLHRRDRSREGGARMTEAAAAVVREPGGAFTLETIEVEAPRAGEVRVEIAGVGLCHTDLIFRDQFAPFALPGILGHEGAGVIEAIGEGVEGLSVGDAVVVGFSSCGACPRCDEHLPSYCQNFVPLNYAGMRLDDGSTAYAKGDERVTSHFFGQSSFSTLTVTRARNVVKVDTSEVALELLGPLGCGFQTGAGGVMNSLACPAGSSIAIFGGGPVGLAAVMGAVIQGFATIILVEPIDARRDLGQASASTNVR